MPAMQPFCCLGNDPQRTASLTVSPVIVKRAHPAPGNASIVLASWVQISCFQFHLVLLLLVR